MGESLAVGVGRPRLTNYTEVAQAIAVAVNEAASGKKQPKDALDSAEDERASAAQRGRYSAGS